MRSAAVAALLAGLSTGAAAQVYSDRPGVTVSIEGRYFWNEGDKVPNWIYLYGSEARAAARKGWGGKAMIDYRMTNGWDFGLGFQAGFPRGHEHRAFNAGGGTFVSDTVKNKLDYQVADFEAGYNLALGGATALRLFGGVRAAWFDQKATGNMLLTGIGTAQSSRRTSYWGVGPRVGVNGEFGLGGALHLFGGLSGAALIGKFKDKHAFVGTNIQNGPFNYAYTNANKTKLVPNLDGEIGLGYRFDTGGGAFVLQAGYRGDAWWGTASQGHMIGFPNAPGTIFHPKDGDDFFHGPFVRLAMTFGAAAAPVAAPAPPPATMMAKNFIVFFDFDRSDLTPQSRATIKQAADASKTGGVQRIGVTGHADKSGGDAYNMALSLRRANNVKDELVRDGVPAASIVVVGRGESQPLVPTADGVREPQNRRVEIVLQ